MSDNLNLELGPNIVLVKSNAFFKLCVPAQIYFLIGLLGTVRAFLEGHVKRGIAMFLSIAVMSYILNLLCNVGYENVAYFLVFLPVIMFVAVLIKFLILGGRCRKGKKK